MPFVTDEERIQTPSARFLDTVRRPSHPLHNTGWELLKAAFSEYHLTGNIVRYFARNEDYPVEEGFDPYSDPQFKALARMFPYDFEEVFSRSHATDVSRRIGEHQENRRVLAQGGAGAFFAGLAAGVIDPINLIPVGWMGRLIGGGALEARAVLAARAFSVAGDDAVRLGFNLLPAERAALVGGVPAQDVVAKETIGLLGMGERTARRQQVGAVAREMAAEQQIGQVRRVRDAQALAGEAGEEALAAMTPLERENFLRSLEAQPVIESTGLARTIEEGVRQDEILGALEQKYAAREEFEALSGRIESLAERKAAEEAAGLHRLQLVQSAHKSALGKFEEHKSALAAARKAGSEGLPSPGKIVAQGAAEGAAVGSLFSGASAVIMEAVQEGNEDDLIVNSVLAGGFLGAFLGGAGGLLSGLSQRHLNQVHLALVEELTAGDLFYRDMAVKLTREEAKAAARNVPRGTDAADGIVDAVVQKVEGRSRPMADLLKRTGSPLRKLLRFSAMNPGGRLVHGISDRAADYARLVLPVPWMDRGTVGTAMMSKVIGIHGYNARLLADKLWRNRGGMDWKDFGRALANTVRSGKPHESGAVNSGAGELTRYFTEWFDAMKREGFDLDADLGADKGYFPRYWNRDRMVTHRQEWIDMASKYVGGPEQAERIRKGFLASDQRNPFYFTSETGRVIERELKQIPSDAAADFLHDDLHWVIQEYAHQVGTQLEAVKLQPTGTIEERLQHTLLRQSVVDELDAMAAAAKSEKQRIYIEKQKVSILKDLDYIRQSALGFLNKDVFDAGARHISRGLSLSASFMYLGNAGFHSMGDLVAPMFVNGAQAYFRTAWARTKGLLKKEAEGMEKRELARAAWLYQWQGGEHSRTGMFLDFFNDHGTTPKEFGGLLRRTHNTWMAANLIRPVTAFANEHATYVAIDELLRISVKLSDGVAPSRGEMNNLVLSGLDEATAAKIGREVKGGGAVNEDGVYLPILSKWSDKELADTFRAAVFQNTHRGVLAPLKGELPVLLNNPLGQILLQFVSYPLNAQSAFLLSGLQRRDAAVVSGSFAMIGIGMFTVALDYLARGEDPPDLNTLVIEGLDRSGIIGLLPTFSHVTSRLTKGVVDINHLVGAETQYEKFGPARTVGDVVPGFSAIEDAASLVAKFGKMLDGQETSDKEKRAMVRRIPPLNTTYISPVVNTLIGVESQR